MQDFSVLEALDGDELALEGSRASPSPVDKKAQKQVPSTLITLIELRSMRGATAGGAGVEASGVIVHWVWAGTAGGPPE